MASSTKEININRMEKSTGDININRMEMSEGQANIIIGDVQIGKQSFPPGSTLEVEYINGKKEGPGKVYTKKRMVLANLSFHEDELSGLCIFRDEKGDKIKECMFEHDVENGWGKEYYENGDTFEGFYKNGEIFSSLEKYKEIPDYYEEKKVGETICICKLNENHMKDGICYEYENDKLSQIVLYENGIKKKVLTRFIDKNRMIELDDNGRMIYKGEYVGNIKNGYKRNGKGMVFTYKDGKVSQVDLWENGMKQGYNIIEGSKLKKYWNNNLLYDGEYCIDDDEYLFHGKGLYYYSTSHFYEGIFNNNNIVRKIKELIDQVVIEYDDNGKAIYKGGYDNNKKERKGDGLLFEYEGKKMIVYSCMNGMKMIKLKEVKENHLIEYNENGIKTYDGDCKEVNSDYIKDGEGDEIDSNDELVYHGHWKDDKKDGEGMSYRNGILYFKGEWKNDKPNGFGKLYKEDGSINWEGDWKNAYGNMGNGFGIDYENGKQCGLYENGDLKYKGEWKDNIPNGNGVLYDERGNKKYEGVWKNGRLETVPGTIIDYTLAEPIFTDDDGVIFYIGFIKNGKAHGNGKVVKNGIVVCDGKWNDGKLTVNENVCLKIEDGHVYVDEKRKSGLFNRSEIEYRHEIQAAGTVNISTDMELSLSYGVHTMILTEGACNDEEGELSIFNYPFLEKLVVKNNSFKNLKGLVISNNDELKCIEIEDSLGWQNDSYRAAFENVGYVILSGIFLLIIYNELIFLS